MDTGAAGERGALFNGLMGGGWPAWISIGETASAGERRFTAGRGLTSPAS